MTTDVQDNGCRGSQQTFTPSRDCLLRSWSNITLNSIPIRPTLSAAMLMFERDRFLGMVGFIHPLVVVILKILSCQALETTAGRSGCGPPVAIDAPGAAVDG